MHYLPVPTIKNVGLAYKILDEKLQGAGAVTVCKGHAGMGELPRNEELGSPNSLTMEAVTE